MITMPISAQTSSPEEEDLQKEYIESKLANAIVSEFQHKDFSQIQREALYQDYKFGGSADLFFRKNDKEVTDYLFELKGKVIREDRSSRQIQKMKNCFYKSWAIDNYLDQSADFTVFEICFYPSKNNLEHLLRNFDLYRNHVSSEKSSKTVVTFRHPEKSGIPVPVISSKSSLKSKEWIKYWKNFPSLFEFNLKNFLKRNNL